MRAYAVVWASITCFVFSVACSDGGSGGGSAGSTANTGGAGGAGSSLCEAGCVETLAAACSNGPTSQAQCVSDCQMLESGTCGTEYRAFQTCADGQAVTCDADFGIPVVEACSAEQSAVIACLN